MAVKKTPKTQSSPVSRDDLPAGQAELSQPSIELKQRSRQGWKWLDRLISLIMWLLAVSLVGLAGYLGWEQQIANAAVDKQVPAITKTHAIQPTIPVPEVEIPGFAPDTQQDSIARQPVLHTIIPTRPREDKVDYTVEQGDSVFGIAQKYNLKPESILWANYDQLQDSPDSLSVGMVLNIPPLDGVYYQWQENDTIASVAAALKAEPGDILNWPGNKLDLTNPVIEAGQYIMVPGGEREFRSWIVPQIARGKAGVSPSVYGAGACAGSYEGAYGTGGFIWPAVNHFLSGNDFWSGHLGIDIAGGLGDSVMASDSGVIVFAGWATGGYGYMIMIDHGNGYQTVYAHLSNVAVSCGQSVYQGGYIGAIGSTGNSTGAHLHFEVRLWGQFVNPWHVLP